MAVPVDLALSKFSMCYDCPCNCAQVIWEKTLLHFYMHIYLSIYYITPAVPGVGPQLLCPKENREQTHTGEQPLLTHKSLFCLYTQHISWKRSYRQTRQFYEISNRLSCARAIMQNSSIDFFCCGNQVEQMTGRRS